MVSNGPSGLSPRQVRGAYGVNRVYFSGGTVRGNGAGQTIAIVDAYHDPNISSDLATFDSQYGLFAPPSFTVKNLGATATDPGWALETSLDVEWAHALAPRANIVLVEASSDSLNSLFDAVRYASQLPGVSVVSMSWGTSEFWGEWNYDSLFTTPAGHQGVTFVASSGDSGAWAGPMYPSVSPNVLAVGGTTLTLGSNNNYSSETGWIGSTGGFSGLDNGYGYGESVPSYQVSTLEKAGLDFGIRTTPDVSFNADPNSGVAVYDSVSFSGQSGWFDVGGTSAAAPAWAGLIAIADQGLATAGKGSLTTAQVQRDLYSLPSSDFHDITSGFNGYQATTGYDLVTGLGSPKANLVIAGVLAANGVTQAANAPKATVVVTVTSVSSGSTQLVLSTFPTNGSGGVGGTATTAGSSGSGSTSNGSSSSSSPTTTASANSPAVGIVAPVQSLRIPNSLPNAQTAPQHSVIQAPGDQSPATSPSFGQSLTQEYQPGDWGTANPSPSTPLIDQIEPIQPPAIAPENRPAPDPGQAPDPPPPSEQPPAQMPVSPNQPMPDRSSMNDFDEALAQAGEGSLAAWREPLPVRSLNWVKTQGTSRAFGISALIGTSAVAAGGFRLVLRPSDQKRQRHLTFRSSKTRD
jgi:subtilase family serine protease